jgi:septal ring factor EnvC (AmiA/AmiB activator)
VKHLTLILALLLAALPSRADVVSATQEALTLLADAQAQLEAVRGKQDRLQAYAQAIRGYEVAMLAARAGLAELNDTNAIVATRMQVKKERVEQVLGAVQIIGQTPQPLAYLHPDGPLSAVRAGMTLTDLLPRLRAEVTELKSEIDRLDTLAALQAATLEDLRTARTDISAARGAVLIALENNVALTRAERDEETRRNAIARNARNLRELSDGLSSLRQTTGAVPDVPLAALKGKLRLPVTGRLLRGFEEKDAAGIARPGMVIGAAPLSIVQAPADALIRYKGTFLDFGNVVILEPRAGVLIVISGLGQVLVRAGQTVSQDDPIGFVGGTVPTDEVFLIESGEDNGVFFEESLYIEIREDGIVQNPQLWFGK